MTNAVRPSRQDVPAHETSCTFALRLLNCRPKSTATKGEHLARVIAVANQKGGVGKTTTAINLSASIALAEKPILLIDADPQGNTTTGLGFRKDPSRRTLYHALSMGENLSRIIIKTQVEGLDLIPSDKNLAGAAVELATAENREYRFKELMQQIRSD